MKKYAPLVIIVITAVLSAAGLSHRGVSPQMVATALQSLLNQEQVAAPDTKLVEVVRVVDGDTIEIRTATSTEKVRLIGVDTPEVVDPRKPVQCFGKEASARTHELLDGKSVTLENDASQGARDKYDRLLAYVFLPDGTNLNKELISEGYAHEYTYDLPYKYQLEFKQAEIEARIDKRGLWADGACK